MVGDNPADRTPELLSVTILRHRRYWQVMWIGRGGKNFRDFHAASMAAAVTGASEMAAEFDCGDPAGADAEFLILIFGRRLPAFKGPQLPITGEPGQFTAPTPATAPYLPVRRWRTSSRPPARTRRKPATMR